MTDRPLHVRTAEALGWKGIEDAPKIDRERSALEGRPVVVGSEWFGRATEDCPKWGALVKAYASYAVPRYDTDWSATGPLIERYGIELRNDGNSKGWEAVWPGGTDYEARSLFANPLIEGTGPTPLVAVCNLILALKEAGKLLA